MADHNVSIDLRWLVPGLKSDSAVMWRIFLSGIRQTLIIVHSVIAMCAGLCVQLAEHKKRREHTRRVLFLFDAFDLSHLRVEHRITSDRYQGK